MAKFKYVAVDSKGKETQGEVEGDSQAVAIAKVREMQQIADELGITLSQLAIAWCVKNPNVSTVITGASTPEQVVENMSAMDAVPLLTKEICDRLDIITLF